MPRPTIGEMSPMALLLTIAVTATFTYLFWKGLFGIADMIVSAL